MPFVTMFRKHKAPGVCADCGQPPRSPFPASSRSITSAEYVCPSCTMWRKTAEQFRGGYWSALLTRRPGPQH